MVLVVTAGVSSATGRRFRRRVFIGCLSQLEASHATDHGLPQVRQPVWEGKRRRTTETLCFLPRKHLGVLSPNSSGRFPCPEFQ